MKANTLESVVEEIGYTHCILSLMSGSQEHSLAQPYMARDRLCQMIETVPVIASQWDKDGVGGGAVGVGAVVQAGAWVG